eukprot:gnl/TRDRNA2_/TRDRNA2_165707_c1_seq1.p1 gnl/TRDRNA2_/TRDRNA2_165707_c1~~gnl/TRDRNA2_/TRDRNA2_165707_c1_seq1.p1  ORF type:complete len:508 (-),score=101.46 gnl/TRDRNA2_/TRDRNA2_165707_c1_seq1:139-1596(-)
MRVGHPTQQEFRVIFDTGSGHVIVPSSRCTSESCLVHRRYNMSESVNAIPVNIDSTVVPDDEYGDQAIINFGTGNLTGEFVRERLCAGSLCISMNMVTAVDMSVQPFKSFLFDGIVGLGLSQLALSDEFSILEVLHAAGAPKTMFSVYLTEGEAGEESEITFGGADDMRFRGPLHWAQVTEPEHGHWQVRIKRFKVGNVSVGNCEKCNLQTGENCCRGIADTGTSHLGVPSAYNAEISSRLTLPASSANTDCRDADGPPIEIEFEGFSIFLHPENYMRRLPLEKGVSVSSPNGVSLMNVDNSTTRHVPTSEESSENNAKVPADGSEIVLLQTATTVRHNDDSEATASRSQHPDAVEGEATADVAAARECRPRLIAVNLPEPLGPNLFIFGEPVLHRYYTVYDWKQLQIGFGEAVNRRSNSRLEREETDDDSVVFMQMGIETKRQTASEPSIEAIQDGFDLAEMLAGTEEVTSLLQTNVHVHSKQP